MKRNRVFNYLLLVSIVAIGFSLIATGVFSQPEKKVISLPKPALKGKVSIEETIARRRTIRRFTSEPLSLSQLSQLLFAAQGITEPIRGKRAAPSAGALYPLEVYIVVGKGGVSGLSAGIYHYLVKNHSLELKMKGDFQKKISASALYQRWVATAPVIFVIAADYSRTTKKYKDRGIRYVHIEVGHCGENIALQAVGLGLGAGFVGAFWDGKLASSLALGKNEVPLYIIPVGHPK